MPQLDDRLARLVEARTPVGAGVMIQRIENRIADAPIHRASPTLHPIRAMTLAAMTMLVFVGGVAVGHWAFGSVGLFDAAFGGADGWITAADVKILAVVVSGVSAGGVLMFGALSLAWRWRRRRRTYRSSIDQGGIMETMKKTTPTFDSTERVLRINRWMAVGLVLALTALVGLGAWLLVDTFAQTDYEALIEDHHAAMNAGDGAAVAAMYTEDAVFVDGDGETYQGKVAIAEMVEHMALSDLRLEITGEITTYKSFLSVPERATLSWGTFDGISVVEFQGTLIKRFEAVATRTFD